MNLLSSLFSLHFFNDGIRTAIVALLPFVAKDLHLNFTQVGFLGSSQGASAFILAILAGFLSTRVGGHKLILLSLLVYSLGILGISLAPNIYALIFAFYLTAGGFGMFHTVGYTLISRISEKTNIGKNLGNFTAIGDIGRILVPAIAIFAVTLLEWRFTYLSIALIGLFVFIFIWLTSQKSRVESSKITPETKESNFEWIKQLALILKQKNFLLIALTGVIDGLAGNPIYIFLPFLLLYKGINVALFGVFMGIYFLGSLSGKSILGRCVDKLGNIKVFIVAEVLMAVCLIVLIIFQQIFPLLAIAFLLGAFTRGTTPVITTLFSEVVHKNHYEKVFGIAETFLGITSAFAPTLMGIIADKFGIVFVFYTASILAIFAIFPVIILRKQKLRKSAILID